MNEPRQAELFRDAALRLVEANAGEWFPRALRALAALSPGLYTGEDIRLAIEPKVGMPHHHNAYGALIRLAVTDHILIPTGRLLKMRTTKSHARRTMEYRKVEK